LYEIPRLPAVGDESWERRYWAWIEGIRISRRIGEFFEMCERMRRHGFQMRVLFVVGAPSFAEINSLGAFWTVTCCILEGLEKGLWAVEFRFSDQILHRLDHIMLCLQLFSICKFLREDSTIRRSPDHSP
jgi:hypothetical protein